MSSSLALGETSKNLNLKNPEWLNQLPNLIEELEIHNFGVDVIIKGLPDKDLQLFQAAVSAKCTHFVTGDIKHFGPMMGRETHGVKVIEPHELAEELDALGWEI